MFIVLRREPMSHFTNIAVIDNVLPIPTQKCHQVAVNQFVVWWGYSPKMCLRQGVFSVK